jgi:exopolysaccharide production protein ExoY
VLNVMRGELSLVGPRPITTRESGFGQQVERAGGPWSGPRGYWQIPGLRPGLTGLWQINGRSAISYEERVRLDKLYAANWSLGLDLLIIAKTLRSLVTSSGAY